MRIFLPVGLMVALAVAGPVAAQATSGTAVPASLLLTREVSHGVVVTPTTAPREPGLAQRLPKELLKSGENQFFTFNAENDSITSQSDRHYTNGVRFTYLDMRDKPPSFTRALDTWLPFYEETDQTAVYYSFGQNMYTSDDIKVKNPPQGQRPYAGWLYGSVGLSTLVDNHVDDVELTLGVVGPLSLAEQTQKTWHRFVGADKPQGWDTQLKNEPGLVLSWNRRWPEFFVADGGGWFIAAEPDVGLTAGNIYTNANAGFNMRFGPSDARWQDAPVRVRPGQPGSGFFARPDGFFNWYLFAGANGRAVARNIFLDGNTFTSSRHVEKNPLVGDLNVGAAATFGRVRLTYTNVYRTKEYNGQAKNDIFSTVSVGYRF